jgi:hypothetical protein
VILLAPSLQLLEPGIQSVASALLGGSNNNLMETGLVVTAQDRSHFALGLAFLRRCSSTHFTV